MSIKHLLLTIFAWMLLMTLLFGCGSTSTPDPSIVWSDDFEDEDTEGWEPCMETTEDDLSINEGALSFGQDGGCIRHPSTVSIGTWSADFFIPKANLQTMNDMYIIASEPDDELKSWATLEVYIDNLPYTQISLHNWFGANDTLVDTTIIEENENLIGWHHVDVTREDHGNIKIYFDGSLYIDTIVDYPHESDYFVFTFCCEGPAFDNVVVRNQVNEIHPSTE